MPNDDAVGKGGWGGENVSKSDDVILVRSLIALKSEFKLLTIRFSFAANRQIPVRFLPT